ncbi:hypothetical protein M422DRAFT_42284 [Sphaerobolus stellatus SS14]|nr:hypothetical protein M422DRAFT_42284 [Sphaerobolus stellatus SS14]
MVAQVKAIRSYNEFTEVIYSGKVVLIDFWAGWCAPCRTTSPIFDKLAANAPAGIEFYRIDTDVHELLTEQVGIRAVPTFHMFKDGEIIRTTMGVNPAGLERLTREAARFVS